jgi:hypothetical protein
LGTVEAIEGPKENTKMVRMKSSLRQKGSQKISQVGVLVKSATARGTNIFSNKLEVAVDGGISNLMFSSINSLFDEVSKHFHSPDTIDKRRKRHFVEVRMVISKEVDNKIFTPNSNPPLSTTCQTHHLSPR